MTRLLVVGYGNELRLYDFAAGRSRLKEGHIRALKKLINDFALYEPCTPWKMASILGFTDSVDSVPDTALVYGGGTGNTGPSVIGSQASPLYVGTGYFPNNQVGYNDFVFDHLSNQVKSHLTTDVNSGGSSEIRFAITPAQGDPVAADWEGNYFFNQPQLTLLVEKTTEAEPPTVTGSYYDNGTTFGATPTSGNVVRVDRVTEAATGDVVTRRAFFRAINGESPQSIAADLGMTVNAIYLLKGRILRQLREEYAGLLEM